MIAAVTFTDGNVVAFMAVAGFLFAVGSGIVAVIWKHTYVALCIRVEEIDKAWKKDVREHGEKLDSVRRRLDTLGGMLFGRGQISAEKLELGEFHSPFAINTKGRSIVPDSLIDLIRPRYEAEWKDVSDRELQLLIAEHYDSEIRDQLCQPNGLDKFECVPLIASILRDGPIHA
jgi:hypothetical protein